MRITMGMARTKEALPAPLGGALRNGAPLLAVPLLQAVPSAEVPAPVSSSSPAHPSPREASSGWPRRRESRAERER